MCMPEGFRILRASSADVDVLVAQRRAMFHDMGYSDSVALGAMADKFREWLLKHMNGGDYHAWLVSAPDGSMAAGAGLWLMDWPPHMIGRGSRRGNILNVYTVEKFRRRGLARELMNTVLHWCRDNSFDTIVLHSSPSGRPLYENMGFVSTNEMRLIL